MELKQVLGRTWVIDAYELIPLYRLDDSRCILLDTGLAEEQDELDGTLAREGLVPVGIICSHAHEDHAANNRFLREKYGCQIALTQPEAQTCCSLLAVKHTFAPYSLETTRSSFSSLVHSPDIIVPPEDGPFSFCGVELQIIHTPGHSVDHICTVTPDGVCYTGDALLSRELLGSKLPYNLDHRLAMQTREKLRTLPCQAFIMAHKGICSRHQINSLIDDNQELLRLRASQILALIDTPMNLSQINHAVCREFKLLTRRQYRSQDFFRNICLLLEYLLDEGLLQMQCRDGVVYYSPSPAAR